jgi:anti-sigma B factor antagonist
MADVKLGTEMVGAVTIVTLGHEYETIDDAALQEVGAFLLDLTAQEDLHNLIIDLSETTFFGSGLLAIILRVYSRLNARSGQLALCELRPHCREVLRTTRLDTLWPVYDSRAEAVSALAQT